MNWFNRASRCRGAMSMAEDDLAFVRQKFVEPLPPPSRLVGPVAWAAAQPVLVAGEHRSPRSLGHRLRRRGWSGRSLDWADLRRALDGREPRGLPRVGRRRAPAPAGPSSRRSSASSSTAAIRSTSAGASISSFLLFAALLVPMAIPKAPYKRENALYLLVAFPARRPRPADRRQFRFQRFDQPRLDRRPRRRRSSSRC